MPNDDKPNETLRELWESLARGGQHWGHDVLLLENEGTSFEAHFYLENPLPPGSSSHVTNYAKDFMEKRGWKTKTSMTRRYLMLAFSKA